MMHFLAHRAHASIQSITKFFQVMLVPCLQKNWQLFTVRWKIQEDLCCFCGRCKNINKLSVLENLITKVDKLLLAGGMANTFLASKKIPVGASLYEPDLIQKANMILSLAKKKCQIILPIDGVVSTSLKPGGMSYLRVNGTVKDDEMILDIGPESIALFKQHISECKTLLWNGPAGAFELPLTMRVVNYSENILVKEQILVSL